jgi:predicted nucleotidyltransferase
MDLFLETAQWRVLSLFLSNALEEGYVNEIARKARVSQGATSVALRSLEAGGILQSKRGGNSTFYRLRQSPFSKRLKSCWLLWELAKDRRVWEREEVVSVALYGSCASGEFTGESDIDILVITSLPKERVFEAMGEAGKGLGMELSLTAMPLSRWEAMAKGQDRFYKEVIANHVVLFGEPLVI